MIGSLIILMGAGAATAIVGSLVIHGRHLTADALSHTLGQWPAVLALTGLVALLAGAAPRIALLGWAPLAASAVLTLLGVLIGAPTWLIHLSVYGHARSATGLTAGATSTLALLIVAAAAAVTGLFGASKRDAITR